MVELSAQLVSEWGELVTVSAVDKPQPLPAGKYRLDGATLKLRDADGQVWTYRFAGTRKPVAAIEKGKEATLDLTAGASVPIELTVEGDGAKPGHSVRVRADVAMGVGLSLTDVEVTRRGGGYGPQVRAAIHWPAGSETVDEVSRFF